VEKDYDTQILDEGVSNTWRGTFRGDTSIAERDDSLADAIEEYPEKAAMDLGQIRQGFQAMRATSPLKPKTKKHPVSIITTNNLLSRSY